MEKNIGEYLSRKSTEVIAIVACIGLIITIILAAGSIRRRLIWSCIQAVCKRNRQMLVF